MPRGIRDVGRDSREVNGARYVVTVGTAAHLLLYKQFGDGTSSRDMMHRVYDLSGYAVASLPTEVRKALRPYRKASDWFAPFGPGSLESIEIRPVYVSRGASGRDTRMVRAYEVQGTYTVYTPSGEMDVCIETTADLDWREEFPATDSFAAHAETVENAVREAIEYFLDDNPELWEDDWDASEDELAEEMV